MYLQTIEITSMSVTDLDEILSIENTSFSTPWTRNMFLQELHLAMSRNLVARVQREAVMQIAGYMIYWIVAGEINIQRIAAGRDIRRSGVASKLMEEVIRISYEDGCTDCILEVGRSNEHAIKLYEKFGFTVRGVRPLYYNETGEDALIMGADLSECMKLIQHEK
jgi:[ribosomal protein S18]-alanine N-acetyltransferase